MQKNIDIDGLDRPVLLARRKGSRNIRISIKNDGEVRLNVPYGVPEVTARKFLASKIDWIKKHQPQKQPPILDSAHIGKGHRLEVLFTDADRHTTKIATTTIRVTLPATVDATSQEAQTIIKKACDKALLAEASNLLPQRLSYLSEKHGIRYNACSVKKLKSRWGACDQKKNISLNIYLVQLEWDLIDYVICHELAHTIHHNHQSEFWELVEKIYPDHLQARKRLKTMSTHAMPTYY